MMTLVIVLFTVVLILNCLFLGLLILIQLPKKEAGAGVAFGGGATDALFGAGSGTALTKLTKYSAISFFGLVLLLSILNGASHSRSSDFKQQLEKAATAVPPQQTAAPAAAAKPAQSNAPAIPLTITTNALPAAKATTNPPVAPAK